VAGLIEVPIDMFTIRIKTTVYGLVALMMMSKVAGDQSATAAAQSQLAISRGDVPVWWNPSLPEEVRRQVHAKAEGLTGKLSLETSKVSGVVSVIEEHYARVWAWHQEVDAKLDAAWADWDVARSNRDGKAKDELRALAIMTERIDPIYAEFTPQILGLLKNLRAVMGDDKTTALLDAITRSPGAERAFNAYVDMIPEMTDEQKAVLWGRMAQARQDSLAAWSNKRIIKIFKKYKVRNEFSIDYFGYDYRKRYEAWARALKSSR